MAELTAEQIASLPPEVRDKAAEIAAEVARIYERNPLWKFQPYPKQAGFLASRHKMKAFFGGNRAGKTEIGVVDDIIQCIDEAVVPDHLKPYKAFQPPFYCRIVSPKFGLNEGVVLQKLRDLTPKDQLLGKRFDRAYDKQNRILRFANGSWIQFLTGEQDVDAHAGAKLDRVHFDEEPEGDKGSAVYRENRMRLIDRQGQLMFTMTPLFGLSWTFDEVWERRADSDVHCVTATMMDNPHLPAKEVERELERMGTTERKARAEGQFVHFQGRMYEEFKERHIVDPVSPSHISDQEVRVIIDPGMDRAGIAWMAFDKDNAAIVFDELYPSGLDVDTLSDLIKAKNRQWGLPDPYYLIDPSARNRTLINAEQVEAAFARNGIYTAYAQNSRSAGILEVKRRLDRDKLMVARNCVNAIWEFSRYLRKKDAKDEFETVGPDHLMDCIRYGCLELAWGPYSDEADERPPQWEAGTVPKNFFLHQGTRESAPMGDMS